MTVCFRFANVPGKLIILTLSISQLGNRFIRFINYQIVPKLMHR